MPRSRATLDAVIANAGTDSTTVTAPANATLLGVQIPASMTGTTLKFKSLPDAAGTPVLIKKPDNTDYSITIGSAAAYYPVDANMFDGVSFVQVISGTAEGAARTLKLVFGQRA